MSSVTPHRGSLILPMWNSSLLFLIFLSLVWHALSIFIPRYTRENQNSWGVPRWRKEEIERQNAEKKARFRNGTQDADNYMWNRYSWENLTIFLIQYGLDHLLIFGDVHLNKLKESAKDLIWLYYILAIKTNVKRHKVFHIAINV